MLSAKERFTEEWDYLCTKLNFAQSALDARCIRFLNEVGNYIREIETESGEKAKVVL